MLYEARNIYYYLTSVCVRVCACVYVYVEARGLPSASLLRCLPTMLLLFVCFFEAEPLTNLEITGSVGLADQRASGTLLSSPPQCQDYNEHRAPCLLFLFLLFLMWVLGT